MPKIEDECVNRLWEEIKKAKVEAQLVGKPPLDEVDFDPKTLVLELKLEQVDIGSKYDVERKHETLKTLPSFLGGDDDQSKNRKLPSHRYGPTKKLDVKFASHSNQVHTAFSRYPESKTRVVGRSWRIS